MPPMRIAGSVRVRVAACGWGSRSCDWSSTRTRLAPRPTSTSVNDPLEAELRILMCGPALPGHPLRCPFQGTTGAALRAGLASRSATVPGTPTASRWSAAPRARAREPARAPGRPSGDDAALYQSAMTTTHASRSRRVSRAAARCSGASRAPVRDGAPWPASRSRPSGGSRSRI